VDEIVDFFFYCTTRPVTKSTHYSIRLFKIKYSFDLRKWSSINILFIAQEKHVQTSCSQVLVKRMQGGRIHAHSFILISMIEILYGKSFGLKICLLYFVITSVQRVSLAEQLVC
jgi:hypothetical protein